MQTKAFSSILTPARKVNPFHGHPQWVFFPQWIGLVELAALVVRHVLSPVFCSAFGKASVDSWGKTRASTTNGSIFFVFFRMV